MYYLIVKIKDGAPVAFPLSKETHLIGRDNFCDIFLADESVSREHAKIEKSGKKYLISDNESLNGTLQNGRPVQGKSPLRKGDIITFGSVEAIFDNAPYGKKTVTRTVPWQQVNEQGEALFPGNLRRGSTLSFVFEIGEALGLISDVDGLLARFSGICHEYLGADSVGFYISTVKSFLKPHHA